MITDHTASNFGMLMEGSVDKTADTKVQKSEIDMMRSNFDLCKPVLPVAIVLKIHPRMAIPTAMALAATE